MGTPCSVVEFRVYDRDGTTLRDTVQVVEGASWSDPLGVMGQASLSAPLVQSALVSAPTMLEDSIVKIATDLDGETLTEIPFAFLGEGGEWDLVADQEDAGKQRSLTCRGLLGLLDDVTQYPEAGTVKPDTGDHRAWGWMSGESARWFDKTQWDGTINATKYKDVSSTADRYNRPKHWPDKNAAWVGCGTKEKQFFRTKLTLSDATPVRILVSADENVHVYVDSELVIKSNSREVGYTKMRHWDGVLGTGVHTVAFKFLKVYERFAAWGLATDYSDVDRAILTVMAVNEFGYLTTVLRRTSDNSGVWLACERDDGERPPAWTAAGIVGKLFDEAVARGVDSMEAVTLGFDQAQDTNGDDWADLHEKSWPVGTKLSQIVTDLGEHGGFDPDLITTGDGLVFNAYKNQGSDVSDTVALTVGGTGDERHLLSYTIGTQPVVANALLVRSAHRWEERADDDAIASVGRREGFVKLGGSLSREQARNRADRILDNYATGLETHTAVIIAKTGCVPYQDFGKGDTIMGLNRLGEATPMRVVSISGALPDSGPLRWTLELQAP